MIRLANKFDIPILIAMIEEFSRETLIQKYKDQTLWDKKYVGNLLYSLILGRGFIVIDEDLNGMIIAMITSNIWCPKSNQLNELAWWVASEQRNGLLGGKLWLEFNKQAQKLLDEKRIDVVMTSLMANSPSIDYSKRGFKQLHTTFFRE
jgi:hypothetical protein